MSGFIHKPLQIDTLSAVTSAIIFHLAKRSNTFGDRGCRLHSWVPVIAANEDTGDRNPRLVLLFMTLSLSSVIPKQTPLAKQRPFHGALVIEFDQMRPRNELSASQCQRVGWEIWDSFP